MKLKIIFALACEKNCMEFRIISSNELLFQRKKTVECKAQCPKFDSKGGSKLQKIPQPELCT